MSELSVERQRQLEVGVARRLRRFRVAIHDAGHLDLLSADLVEEVAQLCEADGPMAGIDAERVRWLKESLRTAATTRAIGEKMQLRASVLCDALGQVKRWRVARWHRAPAPAVEPAPAAPVAPDPHWLLLVDGADGKPEIVVDGPYLADETHAIEAARRAEAHHRKPARLYRCEQVYPPREVTS
jgi:hypothetical protein